MLLGAMAGLYTLALGLTITMYILFARGDGCSYVSRLSLPAEPCRRVEHCFDGGKGFVRRLPAPPCPRPQPTNLACDLVCNRLNIFFISANWVFGFLVSAASVSSAVREHNPTSGILQSGVVFAFVRHACRVLVSAGVCVCVCVCVCMHACSVGVVFVCLDTLHGFFCGLCQLEFRRSIAQLTLSPPFLCRLNTCRLVSHHLVVCGLVVVGDVGLL